DRRGAVDQRVLAVRGLADLQPPVLDGEPGPAGAELRRAGIDEIGAEFVEATQIRVDRRREPARQAAPAAIGLHPLPEMDVVVVLAGIVEEARILAIALLDDLLDAAPLEPRAFQQ